MSVTDIIDRLEAENEKLKARMKKTKEVSEQRLARCKEQDAIIAELEREFSELREILAKHAKGEPTEPERTP